jgi:hypothetical protein
MPDNNTLIPAARVPIWDKITDYVTREWYRWFYNIYVSVENGRRYGSYYDTTTQSIAVINTAYPIILNSVANKINDGPMQYGVYVDPTYTSRVYVDISANYNIQFSLQLYSTNASAKTVAIWLRVNGVDVADSATDFTLKDNNTAAVAAWNFVVNLTAGSYFELMWAADSTAVQIKSLAANAYRPAIPSVILTVTSLVGG